MSVYFLRCAEKKIFGDLLLLVHYCPIIALKIAFKQLKMLGAQFFKGFPILIDLLQSYLLYQAYTSANADYHAATRIRQTHKRDEIFRLSFEGNNGVFLSGKRLFTPPAISCLYSGSFQKLRFRTNYIMMAALRLLMLSFEITAKNSLVFFRHGVMC